MTTLTVKPYGNHQKDDGQKINRNGFERTRGYRHARIHQSDRNPDKGELTGQHNLLVKAARLDIVIRADDQVTNPLLEEHFFFLPVLQK